MLEGYKLLTLSEMANGAIEELFSAELKKVLENIQDINTTLKPRTITIKVGIEPLNEDRKEIQYYIMLESKLANPLGATGFAHITKQNGKPVAVESRLQEQDLPLLQPIEGGRK